mmetsp:Transcript_9869/g.19952  ORF Transcript_9869/g.19952 Transcript_9869/m.19952 type:complete len:210 (+) Transcript_9869:1000-1629(+)
MPLSRPPPMRPRPTAMPTATPPTPLRRPGAGAAAPTGAWRCSRRRRRGWASFSLRSSKRQPVWWRRSRAAPTRNSSAIWRCKRRTTWRWSRTTTTQPTSRSTTLSTYRSAGTASPSRTGCTSCTGSTSSTSARSAATTRTGDRVPSRGTSRSGAMHTACAASASPTPRSSMALRSSRTRTRCGPSARLSAAWPTGTRSSTRSLRIGRAT